MALADPRDVPAGVEAAHRVLVELWTILADYGNAMTVVGGSVPPLLLGEVADDQYVGTLDVDVVLDPLDIPDDVYATIAALLEQRSYYQDDTKNPYQWFRDVGIDGRQVTVEVDLLSPIIERTGQGHRHEVVQERKAARGSRGAELVRDAFDQRIVTGTLPDGRDNTVTVRIARAGALLILKALAIGGRDKPKDAYDVDYILRHAPGGVEAVADEIRQFGEVKVVREALTILRTKFAAEASFGPQTVAMYRRQPLGSAEADAVQAGAYARVRALLLALDAWATSATD